MHTHFNVSTLYTYSGVVPAKALCGLTFQGNKEQPNTVNKYNDITRMSLMSGPALPDYTSA
jgi:hypothetical protein